MEPTTGSLSLTISPHPSLVSAGGASALVTERVRQEVSRLLGDLGVAERPAVHIESNGQSDRFLSLYVDDRTYRYPGELDGLATAYATGSERVPDGPDEALAALQTATYAEDGPDQIAELVAQLCRAALSARPDRLIAALGLPADHHDEKPPPIELLIEPAYLSHLASIEGEALFPFLREGLFVELGLQLPRFHFVSDSSLRPGSFAFRINAVRTLPQLGLADGRVLVNDTPERLATQGIEATPTLNPATWKPGAIVDQADAERLVQLGLTTWDAWGYLILSFAAAVRASAHRLMTRELAEGMIGQMEAIFPTIERAARMYLTVDDVTEVLQRLLQEAVSIRNLRRILELLLRRATSDAVSSDVDPLTFVRSGMADAIASKFARGTGTLVVYLLDPAIERALASSAAGPEFNDRIVGAVESEIGMLPRVAQTPSILTQPLIRARVSDLLRDRFPNLVVLAYGEIPPHYNVQPVARIALPAEP